MAYTRILLDTNTYLRLSKSIKPLLGKPFGKLQYALYLHKEIQLEIDRSNRIKTKFFWLEQEEYKNERKKILTTTKNEKNEIEIAYDYVWQSQKDNGYNLSREDIYCIATALILKIQLVTDDLNMIKTAKDFGVDILKTLELIKLMIDSDFIDKSSLNEIVSYWIYIKDVPGNFKQDFKTIFGKCPPEILE